ncbi:hypothetical protein SESBI_49259 [Sesbania bispinosa]|nr:hypothetical protein SESBI_49259 [Sesbania bispinosa]
MEHWKSIQFTEEEETHVVALSDLEEGLSVEKDKLQYCLVCKVWKVDSFNVRAFKTTMTNIWKTKGGVEIMDLGPNLFSVRFFNERDKEHILKGSPWIFDKHVVVMDNLHDDEELENLPYGEWMRASPYRPTKVSKEGMIFFITGSKKLVYGEGQSSNDTIQGEISSQMKARTFRRLMGRRKQQRKYMC